MKSELLSKDGKVKVYIRKDIRTSRIIIEGWTSYNGYNTNNFFVDFTKVSPKLIWDYNPSVTLCNRAYSMVRHMISLLKKEKYIKTYGIYLIKTL